MSPRPEAVQLRARRSPRLVALGVLAVVLGALGAAALYSMSTDSNSVVVVAHDVVRGQEITTSDLNVISVPAGMQVEAVDGDRLTELVGQTALTDLPAGSFPTSRHLGTQPIPSGHSLVGLRLVPGHLPVAALPPGSHVQLVSLAEGDASATDAVISASPALLDDATGYVLDVIVANDRAHLVATLAAGDQLVLIAVGNN